MESNSKRRHGKGKERGRVRGDLAYGSNTSLTVGRMDWLEKTEGEGARRSNNKRLRDYNPIPQRFPPPQLLIRAAQ